MSDQHANPRQGVADVGEPWDDLARWGFRARDREPDTKTVSARVPVPVATKWAKTVADVVDQTGLTKGAVTGIGFLVAMQHLEDWRNLAASAGNVAPEEGPPSGTS